MWKWAAAAATLGAFVAAIPPVDATKLYICEATRLGTQQQGDTPQIAQMPCIVSQTIDFTAGATQSSAFGNSTRIARLWCDVQCSVKFGSNPTAANTDTPISALTPEYFGVTTGDKVSVITNP